MNLCSNVHICGCKISFPSTLRTRYGLWPLSLYIFLYQLFGLHCPLLHSFIFNIAIPYRLHFLTFHFMMVFLIITNVRGLIMFLWATSHVIIIISDVFSLTIIFTWFMFVISCHNPSCMIRYHHKLDRWAEDRLSLL